MYISDFLGYNIESRITPSLSGRCISLGEEIMCTNIFNRKIRCINIALSKALHSRSSRSWGICLDPLSEKDWVSNLIARITGWEMQFKKSYRDCCLGVWYFLPFCGFISFILFPQPTVILVCMICLACVMNLFTISYILLIVCGACDFRAIDNCQDCHSYGDEDL